MTEADVLSLMEKHHLLGLTLGGAGNAGVKQRKDGSWKLSFDGMPQLTFFVELAQLAGVALETIRTDSEDHGSGCDTCGYGGGTEILAYVPARISSQLEGSQS